MPTTISSVDTKFPGQMTSAFPKPVAVENNGHAGLGIDLETTKVA
jgi:hypothetical protein